MLNEVIDLLRKKLAEQIDEIVHHNARLIQIETMEQAKFNAGRIVALEQVQDMITDVIRRLNAGTEDSGE